MGGTCSKDEYLGRSILSAYLRELYLTVTIIIMDIIHRPVFYLKLAVDNVLTSQETQYVSAKSPKGECDL
jgi:hypothetical protein